MKNLYGNLNLAIILILLTLALTSCVSRQKLDVKEIIVPVVPALDNIFFPSFPYPEDGIIIPKDKDGNIVVSENVNIETVEMPYWYWQQIKIYVIHTEQAVTALEEVKKPP